MAMFYFIKRLPALRIVTEPCADHILLFGRFPYSCITLLMSAASDGVKNDLCRSVPKWTIASMARLNTSLAL